MQERDLIATISTPKTSRWLNSAVPLCVPPVLTCTWSEAGDPERVDYWLYLSHGLCNLFRVLLKNPLKEHTDVPTWPAGLPEKRIISNVPCAASKSGFWIIYLRGWLVLWAWRALEWERIPTWAFSCGWSPGIAAGVRSTPRPGGHPGSFRGGMTPDDRQAAVGLWTPTRSRGLVQH